MIVLVCLNPFLPILNFFDFGTPVYTLRKSWNIPRNFARFWEIFGNFKEIPSLLHWSKARRRSGGTGGVQESKKIEIGQNVFKQPKTTIESRPGTPRSVPGPYRDSLRGPSGTPPGPLRGACAGGEGLGAPPPSTVSFGGFPDIDTPPSDSFFL